MAARRQHRRPPSHQNLKDMTDISLWVSILGLFGLLISIVPLDMRSADLTVGQGTPAAGHGSPAARRHTKILRKRRIYRYGYRFWGYLDR